MYAEFSDKNITNWLNFFCNFVNKEDEKTIRVFVKKHSFTSKLATNRALYNKYWK